MSILARDWAYSQALAAPAKFVLVALAEHVSGEGRACWHSVSRQARMTGYAERSVRRALRALEAAGLVRIERRPGRPALYSLNLSTTPARESGVSARSPWTESPPTPDRESGDPGLSVRRTEKNRKRTGTHTQPNPEIYHNVCVEFAGKISRGGVRSATGLLAALCRAAGIAVLVTDEIARETAARGGYSGPWPHRAADIAQRATRKRAEIMSRAEMAKHALRGETWDELEHRLSRALE